MIVYRLTDRVPVKIEGVTFWIAPLGLAHKVEIDEARKVQGGQEVVDYMKRAAASIRHSVKKVDGLKLADGSDYELKLAENGSLSDESVDDLLNLPCAPGLVAVCLRLVDGINDPKMKGVKVDFEGAIASKKKD